jgi:hypothetical protein
MKLLLCICFSLSLRSSYLISNLFSDILKLFGIISFMDFICHPVLKYNHNVSETESDPFFGLRVYLEAMQSFVPIRGCHRIIWTHLVTCI